MQDENCVPASFGQVYKKPTSQDTGTLLNMSTHGDTSIPDLNATDTTSFVHESRPLPTVNTFINTPEDMGGSSLPPPLIPVTHAVAQLLPMNHIQINQQPTQCSHTSITVTQPFCSVSVPAANHLPQRQTNPLQPQSNPFFVKFLSKQIRICQGCRSRYQRNLNGDPLPPPYDIIIGHFERQQYSDQVTGLTRLSRETCVHYHAFLQCIYAKFPDFQPTELSIPKEVFIKLNATHKSFLNDTFGTCL